MNTPVRWLAPDLMAPPAPDPADVFVIETITEADHPVVPPAPVLQLPTLEEIQAVQDAARKEGFEQGRQEGFAQGQSEVRRLSAQIEGILDNFSRPLSRLENEVVSALGELAVRIAGQLVGRAYESDPTLLASLVNEAIAAVGGAHRDVEVRLHPDDMQALLPLLQLPDDQRMSPDLSLSRGDLRVHAESVRIDGTLDSRLRAALATVMRRSGAGQ